MKIENCCHLPPMVEEAGDEKMMYTIFCQKCGTKTFPYHDIGDAYKSWNEITVYKRSRISALTDSPMLHTGWTCVLSRDICKLGLICVRFNRTM